jgi:ketosteroid isomerase-like protein
VSGVHIDDEFAAAIEREHSASEQVLRGDNSELKELCTHTDDISLAGRGGGYERGWAEVSARFDWVAAQYVEGHLEHRLLAAGHSGDLGYSFELVSGRMRFVGAEASVPVALRETHIWRREADGWKLLHRHADQLMVQVERLADITPPSVEDGHQHPAAAGEQ